MAYTAYKWTFKTVGNVLKMQEVSGNSDNENGQVNNNDSNISEGVAGYSASLKKPEKQKSIKRKADPVEPELLNVIKRNDRHSSYFAGTIPSLETFDDDEVVEFQLKVLQTVSDIKKRKQNANSANQNTTRLPTPDKQNDIVTVEDRQYLNLQPRPSTSSTAAQYYQQVGSSPSSIELSEQFSKNSSFEDFHF
ncbi:hypothetical protein J6590_084907 [Homalodisca vitripennis]|nr:hypothetical protein J6590_099144 [Homalodisca vitripennis]KAG8304965.1 hypothetical protein J6590_081262 [Homalodisca vitripennis]KAG8334680.1 hypothetical protein J6590_084907 [Homalodisca vitripennis]